MQGSPAREGKAPSKTNAGNLRLKPAGVVQIQIKRENWK